MPGPRKKRPNFAFCKCKSHCTKFNALTGLYEGGRPQPRSTRDNHSKDDKALLLAARNSGPNIPIPSLASLAGSRAQVWIQGAYHDINSLVSTLPMSHPQRPFAFVNAPAENGPFIWPGEGHMLFHNQGLYALQLSNRTNRQFLTVALMIQELYSFALRVHAINQDDEWEDFLSHARQKLDYLTRLVEVEWARQRADAGHDKPYINTEIYLQPFPQLSQIEKVSMLTSVVMENIFFVPRRALRAKLGAVRSILRANGASKGELALVPKDPRSGPYRASLDPITQKFVACPSCHYLYPYYPGNNLHSGNNPPTVCNQRRTPGSPQCSTLLWKEKMLGNEQKLILPIRTYAHQDLKSWIGRMLCRKGMEKLLKMNHAGHQPTDFVSDIWFSRMFKDLKDVNGQAFFPAPREELRIAFSLSVDSFNPFHMKTAKQTVSSTGIWMVLLNLPQHLRYLQENMYLAGVIPGPDKPSKEDIYPYVELVIKELLELWYTGVYYSRTYEMPLGRLVMAVLLPLICDMLAARQIIGFSSATSHYFCTFCDIDIDDIDIFDRSEWQMRDVDHVKHIAMLWRDATTEEERDALFNAFGIMWSPLHLLPYWDVVRCTIVDPMHALDLNLLQNHCRSIFRIDANHDGGDGFSLPPTSGPKPLSSSNFRHLKRCIDLIRENGTDLLLMLVEHPRVVLFTICVDNKIFGEGHRRVVGTKWILSKNIVAWRNRPTYHQVVMCAADPTLQHAEIDELDNQEEVPPDATTANAVKANAVARVLRKLLDPDLDRETARDKAYGKGSAEIFAHICRIVGIQTDDIDFNKRSAKRQLFDKLISKIDDNQETLEELHALIEMPETASRISGFSRIVLGKNIMENVWEDMKCTVLPTWVTPAPSNWGTTQRGKLSADNWRVICTIHLPITLIRLWANTSERQKQMLSHFMDLVSAVRIANMRITSEHQIQTYNKYMNRYISSIKILYPDENLKPLHHAALHIGDMLGFFGPNHAHSGPHYERYINFFHRINNNSKLGQLEQTLLNSSVRSANARALIASHEDSRKAIQELITVMDAIESEDVRGFRLASILDPDSPTYTSRSAQFLGELTPTHHAQVCGILAQTVNINTMPKDAIFLKEVSLNGVCYGVSTESTFKNSYIVFRDSNSSQSSTKAGFASKIFQYQYAEGGRMIDRIFLVVQDLEPIEAQHDLYRQFEFGGFLCRQTHCERVISLAQVKSHFASTKMGDLIHVLPIDRLMLNFLDESEFSDEGQPCS